MSTNTRPTITPSPALAQTGQPCTPAQPSGGPQPGTAGKAVPAYQLAGLLLGGALIEQGFSTEQTGAWVGGSCRVIEAEQARAQIERGELISGAYRDMVEHGNTVALKVQMRSKLAAE